MTSVHPHIIVQTRQYASIKQANKLIKRFHTTLIGNTEEPSANIKHSDDLLDKLELLSAEIKEAMASSNATTTDIAVAKVSHKEEKKQTSKTPSKMEGKVTQQKTESKKSKKRKHSET
jgi:hypothetical protein